MQTIGPQSRGRRGLLLAFFAYCFWGLCPLYWKQLGHVDALEVLAHRIFWSAPALALVLTLARGWREVWSVLRTPRQLAAQAVSMLFIATNWYIFVWAINNDQVIEASLGYYLTPLLNVLLGMLCFRERLSALQWLAVALAVAGVGSLVHEAGTLPWVALALGSTFATYGALRKRQQTDALAGLFLETLMLSPIALVYGLWLMRSGAAAFLTVNRATDTLLALCG